MPRKIREFEKLNCDHCGREFTPTNPRQRACNKKKCKKWILGQNRYKPVEYRFNLEFIKKFDFWDPDHPKRTISSIKFTKNDLIKIGDKNE